MSDFLMLIQENIVAKEVAFTRMTYLREFGFAYQE